MAEKTKTGEIERIYTIPLRRDWLKEPRSKRSKRARREVEKFLRRHTKSNQIKISKGVNELIFSQGFKKPPGKIKVEVKGDFETIQAKLPGEVIGEEKKKKTGIAGLKERFTKKEGKGETKETKAIENRTEEKPKEEKKQFKKEKEKK